MKEKLILLASVVLAFASLGCSGGDDDGLTSKDKETASRLDKIAQDSGGDWAKVPDADKQYILKDVAMGSEQTAKMIVQGRAGKIKGGSSAPPTKAP